MRGGAYADWPWSSSQNSPRGDNPRWYLPWKKVPDISGDFGYVFGSSTGTNVSASTVVGSSDIYGDASLGFPIIRYASQDYLWKQQATIEVSGGFATDRQFDDVHPNVFVGGGYEGKFPNFTGSTNLPVFWFGRVGLARIDRPTLSGTNVVFSNAGGLSAPVFHGSWVPAIGTSIIVPITKTLSIEAGGDAYFSSTPANWNITLGVTLDLDAFAKQLGIAFGASQ